MHPPIPILPVEVERKIIQKTPLLLFLLVVLPSFDFLCAMEQMGTRSSPFRWMSLCSLLLFVYHTSLPCVFFVPLLAISHTFTRSLSCPCERFTHNTHYMKCCLFRSWTTSKEFPDSSFLFVCFFLLFQHALNRLHTNRQRLQNTTTIAQSTTTPQPGKPSFRARIWKLLLEVHHVSAQEYISLVKMGKPEENGTYNKIRNDTFRTMATDKRFLDVVDEDRLIRVLCAFAWKMHAPGQNGESFSYVQGMNVLAAPFLYAMSEMDAFYSFSNFIQFCCPLYVQPALQGVHCGIKLLEECLRAIDLELYESLRAKRLSAELYAFPSVLTLCACTPPLDQAMQLWDFLLAWGLHLNIICIIAQMILIRQDLLEHASPMKLLRIFPDLDAPKIIAKTMEIIRLVPDPLYDMLVRHPYDKSVAVEVEAYAQGGSA